MRVILGKTCEMRTASQQSREATERLGTGTKDGLVRANGISARRIAALSSTKDELLRR
jgi:hypothetical protein